MSCDGCFHAVKLDHDGALIEPSFVDFRRRASYQIARAMGCESGSCELSVFRNGI